MRHTTATLAAVLTMLTTLALATGVGAVPPSPNHHVIDTLGRNVQAINHFGDPNRGRTLCSAQGETVDVGPNFNGTADALRGRGACLETRPGIRRYRLYWIKLQVFHAETWQNVAISDQDKVDERNPAYVIDYTPVPGFCSPILLTYRVQHATGIRYDDGTASTRIITSHQFQARGAINTQVCP